MQLPHQEVDALCGQSVFEKVTACNEVKTTYFLFKMLGVVFERRYIEMKSLSLSFKFF